jgi:hypothetical protein
MSLDFEELDVNELRSESKRVNSESTGGGGGYSDEYLEKFVRLPERDGFVLMRLLPKRKGQKLYCATRTHMLTNPTTRQKKSIHCPKVLTSTDKGDMWKGECIICKYYSDLWQKSDSCSGKEQEDLQNKARELKPLERYYYNVIVRSESDPKNKSVVNTNVGPKIYSCGKQVHARILRAILGDEAAGEKGLGDITNPTTGRDFRLVKKVVKSGNREYPNYDHSKFEDVSSAGTPAELEKWLSNLNDLQGLRKLRTVDEMKHALRVHVGMVVEGDRSADSELDEFRNADASMLKSARSSQGSNSSSSVISGADNINEEAIKPKPSAKSAIEDDSTSLADEEFMKDLEGI